MIDLQRFTAFAASFDRDLPPELERIRVRAENSQIPVIRREMQAFLRFLLHVCRPDRILEIGTGNGFSALLMNECLKEALTDEEGEWRIDTIENNPERAGAARGNMMELKAQGHIRLIQEEAGAVISALDDRYGLIFLDGPKGQYSSYLPDLIRLLKPGGILVADNIVKNGEMMESRYAVERRQRTIHARMREYLYEVTHDARLSSCILPVGDGVALSVRLPEGSCENDKQEMTRR